MPPEVEAQSLNHGTSREVTATFHLMTSPDTSLYPTIIPKVCRRAATELKAYTLRSLLIFSLALPQNLLGELEEPLVSKPLLQSKP